jgi:hypothetical protein
MTNLVYVFEPEPSDGLKQALNVQAFSVIDSV